MLAVAVYANAPANGFALDDEFILLNNERVHGAEHLLEAVSSPYWPRAPGRIGMYRPLTAASFAIEWELWGDRAAGYHVTNVLIHAAVTLLVFGLLLWLAGFEGAVAGAAIFAVHPVHVEAVSNIVGRGELLAALFVLLACHVYLRSERASGERRRERWAALAVGGCYFLALGAKEIAVTLPAALLLLELARPDATLRDLVRRIRDRWLAYAAMVLALIAYLTARTIVLSTTLGNDPAPFLHDASGTDRVLTAISVWPEYLRLMVFPRELVSDYSPGVIMPATSLGMPVLAGLATALLLAGVTILAWRRERLVSLGIAWGVLVLLPVSNLFFAIGIMLAERTLYLPSVGLAIAVAGAVRLAWSARRAGARVRARVRPVLAAGGLVILAAAGWRTWTRTPEWADSDTAIRALARDHPESFRVQWVLADRMRARGDREAAIERYADAVALMPAHYQLRFQFGTTLLELGKLEEAAEQFDLARRFIPDYPDAHIYRVGALVALGRYEQAVAEGRAAVDIVEPHRGLYHQLSLALGRTGRFDEAADMRRRALDLASGRAHWNQWLHLAELEVRRGRSESARRALASARAQAPASATVPSVDELARAIETEDPAVLPYR